MNVMTLAWKILKNSKTIKFFRSALLLAWNILKRATIEIIDNTIVYTLIKALAHCDFYSPIEKRRKNKIIIEDSQYSFNMMNYELSNQTI